MHTKVEKYKRNGNGNELRCGTRYGPIFGFRHDFFTFGSGGSMLQHCGPGGSASFELHKTLIDNSVIKTEANFQLEVLQVGTVDNAELMEP